MMVLFLSPPLLLFKRAKRTHKSAFVFGCVVLSKLSLGMEKRMKKNSAAAAKCLFWWSHLKERGRETFVVTAHHHFHQRRLLYVHTTRVMRYVVLKRINLSLSLTSSIIYINSSSSYDFPPLNASTTLCADGGLVGSWSALSIFLIGGTHTGNAAPIAPKAHDHTTIGSRCKKVVQNPAIFDSFYFDSSFFCLCCCEEEVNLRTRLSLATCLFFLAKAVFFWWDVQKEIYY